MKFHCFFEQSGTFKNEFKKLGYEAEDYDILNDFGETDHVIDLFAEIEKAYGGGSSIFDSIEDGDQIIAFFPCVRFENQIMLSFRGQIYQMKNWKNEQKMQYDMKLIDELRDMYLLINKLFIVCMRKEIKMIVENPYSEEHFLRRYWCLPPTMIDRDRRERGDYYKKPTQYWFINRKPSNNLILEAMPQNAIDCKDSIRTMHSDDWQVTGAKNRKAARSMIHPDYANRFIREFII